MSGRLRYRPLAVNSKLGAGVFVRGLLVEGEAGNRGDEFKKSLWAAGPTLKFYGKGSDTNLDLGFGRVYESGFNFDDSQAIFNPFVWHTAYGRRMRGKVWFPKWELGGNLIVPFGDHDADDDGGRQRDFRAGELSFNQWIYDWKINDDVRFSLGLETGLGFSKSGNDHEYYRVGPAVSLDYQARSILSLGVSYKDKIGQEGDLWLIGGNLHPGNVWKLIKASGITKPSPKDLKIN